MMCRRQVIQWRDEKGIYSDISIPAVKAAMDARGIVNQWECMQKVRNLFFAMRERDED